MSINYHTLSEFDIIAKYTKESGLGTDLIAGLKSIKRNWDNLDEDTCDAYEEIVYQLSEFIKEGDYHV
jgi:hypothetical protein